VLEFVAANHDYNVEILADRWVDPYDGQIYHYGDLVFSHYRYGSSHPCFVTDGLPKGQFFLWGEMGQKIDFYETYVWRDESSRIYPSQVGMQENEPAVTVLPGQQKFKSNWRDFLIQYG
jgi:hypothetical protein